MAHHWILQDGWFNEDKTKFSIKGNIALECDVEFVTKNKSYKERESLGNGWYGSATETTHYVDKTYYAYHNGYLIGEIIQGTFSHELHKHIKISRTK